MNKCGVLYRSIAARAVFRESGVREGVHGRVINKGERLRAIGQAHKYHPDAYVTCVMLLIRTQNTEVGLRPGINSFLCVRRRQLGSNRRSSPATEM